MRDHDRAPSHLAVRHLSSVPRSGSRVDDEQNRAVEKQHPGYRDDRDPYPFEPETLADRNQEQRGGQNDGEPHVLVGVLPGVCCGGVRLGRLIAECRSLSGERVAVLGHVARPHGRLGIGEGIGKQPKAEGDGVAGGEAPGENGGELRVARRLGLQPGGEVAGVVDELLVARERGLLALYAQSRRRGVAAGADPVPLGGLVAAQRGAQDDDRQQDGLDDLDQLDSKPALALLTLMIATVAVFAQVTRNLGVHVAFRHVALVLSCPLSCLHTMVRAALHPRGSQARRLRHAADADAPASDHHMSSSAPRSKTRAGERRWRPEPVATSTIESLCGTERTARLFTCDSPVPNRSGTNVVRHGPVDSPRMKLSTVTS